MEGMNFDEPEARETKEAIAYSRIRDAVLFNEFKPGSVLVERKLAEQLGVSRSPVRYALRQLVKEGLLDDEPGKGIVVPAFTLEDILGVYDLLEILQVYALQMSLKNYDEKADQALEEIMEETRCRMDEGDLVERMKWDVRFHKFIIRHVNNKWLDKMFDLLLNQKQRFDITSYGDMEHGRQTTGQHEKMYEAILARDLEGAIRAEKEHSQYIKQYYIGKLVTERYNVWQKTP